MSLTEKALVFSDSENASLNKHFELFLSSRAFPLLTARASVEMRVTVFFIISMNSSLCYMIILFEFFKFLKNRVDNTPVHHTRYYFSSPESSGTKNYKGFFLGVFM